jgi:hypothetical protein
MPYRDDAEPDHAQPRHRNKLVWGVAALAVALAGAFALRHTHAPSHAQVATQQMGAGSSSIHDPQASPAKFGSEAPTPDARLLANWVVGTHDNGQHAFILVDKKDARAYVFRPDGQLQDSAPVLLGAAHGDTIAPGSGDKPLSQMTQDEKITPTGRFVAKPGVNADDEDVIWVDYDDAISMHRVRPKVESEHRLERLASLTTDDNRISFGCINLPVSFYEDVAKPTVDRYGAVIYVLPEQKSLQEVFNAYDVTDPAQMAAHHAPVHYAAGRNERAAG